MGGTERCRPRPGGFLSPPRSIESGAISREQPVEGFLGCSNGIEDDELSTDTNRHPLRIGYDYCAGTAPRSCSEGCRSESGTALTRRKTTSGSLFQSQSQPVFASSHSFRGSDSDGRLLTTS